MSDSRRDGRDSGERPGSLPGVLRAGDAWGDDGERGRRMHDADGGRADGWVGGATIDRARDGRGSGPGTPPRVDATPPGHTRAGRRLPTPGLPGHGRGTHMRPMDAVVVAGGHAVRPPTAGALHVQTSDAHTSTPAPGQAAATQTVGPPSPPASDFPPQPAMTMAVVEPVLAVRVPSPPPPPPPPVVKDVRETPCQATPYQSDASLVIARQIM